MRTEQQMRDQMAVHQAHRDAVVKDVPSSHVIDKDGDLTINRLSFDAITGRFHNRRIVIRDGVRKDKPFSIRLYNATEIRDLLHRVVAVSR